MNSVGVEVSAIARLAPSAAFGVPAGTPDHIGERSTERCGPAGVVIVAANHEALHDAGSGRRGNDLTQRRFTPAIAATNARPALIGRMGYEDGLSQSFGAGSPAFAVGGTKGARPEGAVHVIITVADGQATLTTMAENLARIGLPVPMPLRDGSLRKS